VDGQDARAVFEAARRAITQAREGGGPVLIECVTYRIAEHVLRHDAPVECARGEERDFWQNRDPVRRFRALLTRDRLAHAETLAVIDHAARADVDAAARALFGSPDGGSNAGMALMPLHRAASPWN
jgi:TPP-dependent pyruvate/acetoin dehydrogenase alpha subunit